MPEEQKSRKAILEAIRIIPAMASLLSKHEDHFDYELDLEVVVYGRNYGGKKVGPYVRLLNYAPGEVILNQGDWGGNTFYFVTAGKAEVYLSSNGSMKKSAEIPAGLQFGEMSILSGLPRSATICAPADEGVQVLEVQRPALRLLRKLPKLNQLMDRSYRTYGKRYILERLQGRLGLDAEAMKALERVSRFRVYAKNHALFRAQSRIAYIYFLVDGWLKRSQQYILPEDQGALICWNCRVGFNARDAVCNNCGAGLMVEDFVGTGYCFGSEGLHSLALWPFSGTVLGRTELLEISVRKAQMNPALCDVLLSGLGALSPPPVGSLTGKHSEAVQRRILAAQDAEIGTGVSDGTNLLVMDMDLCVRCGNCSLACHKVHGQSRLIRRGIHLSRPKLPDKPRAIQSVLVPEVCMHCKDPECMTGCPTGAISRLEKGQIDISPRTCIGCGDCATQCPYKAITMIPRKRPAAPSTAGWKARAQNLFRIKLDPLPPATETLEDLVAVKCNLCENTSLNPKGSVTQAYSCEENCPTGALARINPHQYFVEIGQIENFTLLDRTHAIGRNIHRSDPPKMLIHFLGIAATLFVTALTIGGLLYFGMGGRILSFLNMRWLTGIIGLFAIAGAMAYPFRRQVYTRRAGPLRYWLLFHGYSGVIAAILILLHGGVDSGGLLTTFLMISFDLVIFTGIAGIALYYFVPRLMTKIESEPLLIDDLITRRSELTDLLAAGAKERTDAFRHLLHSELIPFAGSLSFLFRQYSRREDLVTLVQNVQKRFESQIAILPELEQEDFRSLVESAVIFRRVDALIYLHRLLKLWLPPHIISTSLMLALMFVHIIQVIYYAWR